MITASRRAAEAQVPASLRQMRPLLSPFGLVSKVSPLLGAPGEPPFSVYSGSLGNPGAALDAQAGWQHDISQGNFDGAGGSTEPETAAHLALAESLERYSSCAWNPERLHWANAAELGDDAITPQQLPNCSEAELADPRSGLVPLDSRLPLRWVQGWSFTRGRPVYVPAVAAWLRFPALSAAERFMHPISTGCAAHVDPAAAVVNGLQEVVERDSIALTWLQRLRLPRLEFTVDELPPELRTYVTRGRSEYLRTLLFDATTDLGIPVIYGVQLADHDPVIAQLVAATCDVDPVRAVAKLHREAAPLRIALRHIASNSRDSAVPDDAADTTSVFGGALQDGAFAERHRFDFLLRGERPTHRISDLPDPQCADEQDRLGWLLQRLEAAGCEVVVVDMTTDEARQVGATVVRVIVPQLMPLSFVHRARYLAHPRLYQAPRAMGHTVHSESEINPHPQPFA